MVYLSVCFARLQLSRPIVGRPSPECPYSRPAYLQIVYLVIRFSGYYGWKRDGGAESASGGWRLAVV